jgi:hypothetical protein
LLFEHGPYRVQLDIVETDGKTQVVRLAAVSTLDTVPVEVVLNETPEAVGTSFVFNGLTMIQHDFTIPMEIQSVELHVGSFEAASVSWKTYTLWRAQETRPTAWAKLDSLV